MSILTLIVPAIGDWGLLEVRSTEKYSASESSLEDDVRIISGNWEKGKRTHSRIPP
jgi:hypothetical protein